MIRKHSRRSFLGSAIAAGSVLNLPFLGRERPAHAAPNFNVMFVFVPDGIVPSLWHAKGTEREFTLAPMTQPLEEVKSDCIFLGGVGMFAGEPTHPGGTKKVLTGTGPQSLDVFLGQKLKGSAPFEAVQLGVATNFENGSGSVSFIGQGQEVKPDDNPLNAFDRLFAGGKGGGMTTPEEMLRERQKQSVLDAVRGDLMSLQAKLGNTEKSRLDIHMQALRDLESRATTMVACDTASWNKGGFKPTGNSYDYPKFYHRPENFVAVGQLQMDLAVLALSCGLTRAVTLMWSHAVSPTKVPGVNTVGGHDASHYGVNPMSENAKQFVAVKRWYMERFKSLIQAMKRTPYNGGTLLDSTIVFLCSDISDGDLHDHKNMPFVLAGGSKMGFKTGRYLDFGKAGTGGTNESHAKILVSIARAMGADVDRFGYIGHGTGGLPGLI